MKRDWWLIIVILVLALALIATKVRQDRAGSKKTEVRPTAHAAPLRPNVSAFVSADGAEHSRLEFTEGHLIRPAIGTQHRGS